jgi:small subunit ribosomal protein S3
MKEFQIGEFISENLRLVGHSQTKLQRTPLGEKIIIYAARPGLIVGRKGESIKKLTKTLKKRFDLENPQIEIAEVQDINLDAQIIGERIASSLEKFGTTKFKAVGHKAMADVMGAGALGIEILISGKIPSSRAKSWRFYMGYLKKCGDVAEWGVRKSIVGARLKSGVVGIQVKIMPPDIELPDKVTLIDEHTPVVEEVTGTQEAADVEHAQAATEAAADGAKKKRAPKKEAKEPKAAKPKASRKKEKTADETPATAITPENES